MTALEAAAAAIDEYAGAAGDIEPVGTCAIPIRLLVNLRRALRDEHRARVREIEAGPLSSMAEQARRNGEMAVRVRQGAPG